MATALLVMTACACGADAKRVAVLDFVDRVADGRIRPQIAGYDFSTEEHRLGLLSDGWSTPEPSPDGEVSFAWAVARKATLKLRVLNSVLNREAAWLHFRCWPYIPQLRVQQRVRVSLNGTELGAIQARSAPHSYSLPIPERVLAVGENTLTFRFSYAETPQAGSNDTRTLAAAFDFVSISSSPEALPAERDVRPTTRRRVDGDRLVQPTASELVFPVIVPQRGILEYSLAPTTTRATAELVVRRQGAAEQVILTRPTSSPTLGRERVDLSNFAGQQVDIAFRAVEGRSSGSVSWEGPRLLGDLNNVLLIVVDTLRADYLGSYGGQAATPNIDALAASGVRFERAYSHVPITGPSHSTMFTSLLPRVHGVRSHFQALGDEHVTLAELLQRSHRHTAAFVSLGVLKAVVGLSQGFDEYHDRFGLDWWKAADKLNEEMMPWIAHQKAPFFLWAHYSDPHEPYAAADRIYPRLRVRQESSESVDLELAADATTVSIPLVIPPGKTEIRVSSIEAQASRPIRLRGIRTTDPQVEARCASGCEGTGKAADPAALSATIALYNRHDREATIDLMIRAGESPDAARATAALPGGSRVLRPPDRSPAGLTALSGESG